MEKLRLVALFTLKYEQDKQARSKLNSHLKQAGVKMERINNLYFLTQYGGQKQRSGDLFMDKFLQNKVFSFTEKLFQDVPNVYTQHQPYLSFLIKMINTNSLTNIEYPYISQYHNFTEKPMEIVVFFIGGTTYEEAREMEKLSKELGVKIVLGGNYVHNSKTFAIFLYFFNFFRFLAEIGQLKYQRQELL